MQMKDKVRAILAY